MRIRTKELNRTRKRAEERHKEREQAAAKVAKTTAARRKLA